MEKIITVGLDLAKSIFQVHGIAENGKVLVRRTLRRSQVLPFFRSLPACLVGMEACASAHHWAREIAALGHAVRMMPPAYVKPYVKRNKTDVADAEAICEAVTRPTMRFVPVKTAEQQAASMILRTRELLMRQRSQTANALRAHMAELGIIAGTGMADIGFGRSQFATARDFAAWTGLTPRAQSSGGKERLGAISKRGNRQLRTLLIVGATSIIKLAKRGLKVPLWIRTMLQRRPVKVVSVALANKIARTIWTLLVRGGIYQAPAAMLKS
ncbi:transposase [Bradyrhizobium sp. GM5.1]